jgi:hypothetical protein
MMNQWETDFAKAVAALEVAFEADRLVYEQMPDDSKARWGLLPMAAWPVGALRGPMAKARVALLTAEEAVCSLVRRRSVAIREARRRRVAMHERSAFAPTIRLDIDPAGALMGERKATGPEAGSHRTH